MYILSSDFDNTLFVNENISKEDMEAIKRFRQAGNLFIINTGRNFKDISEQVSKWDIEVDYFIASNGSLIVDSNNKILYKAQFDSDIAYEVAEYFEKELKDYVFYIASNDGEDIGYKQFEREFEFDKKWYIDLDKALEKPIISMFSQVVDEVDASSIIEIIKNNFKDRLLVYNTHPFIDISQHENNKAKALDILSNLLEKEYKIITIGDNRNDLSMLLAYDGYIVDFAEEHMKKEIKKTIPSVAGLINKIMGEQ